MARKRAGGITENNPPTVEFDDFEFSLDAGFQIHEGGRDLGKAEPLGPERRLRMSIVNLFKALRDDLQVSIVYITHDLTTAYYISDRIIIMQKGKVVEEGDARNVLSAPQASLLAAFERLGAVAGRVRGRWFGRTTGTIW